MIVQLISITISDKSVMVRTTGQENANKHCLTTVGHIWSIARKCHLPCLKLQGMRVGYLTNHDKSAVVLVRQSIVSCSVLESDRY